MFPFASYNRKMTGFCLPCNSTCEIWQGKLFIVCY